LPGAVPDEPIGPGSFAAADGVGGTAAGADSDGAAAAGAAEVGPDEVGAAAVGATRAGGIAAIMAPSGGDVGKWLDAPVGPSGTSLAWPTKTVFAVPTSAGGADAGASFCPQRPQKPKPAGLWKPHALHGGGGAKAIGSAAPPLEAAAVGPLPDTGLGGGGAAMGEGTDGGAGGRGGIDGGAVTEARGGAMVPPLIGSPGWPGGFAGPRKGGGGVEAEVEGGGGGAGRPGGGPAAPKLPAGAAGAGAAAEAPCGSFEPQPRQNL
jgi:hypothetical protein